MLIFAHRGASEYAPENTVLSFSLGLLMGADAVETDVRRSTDGVLYLFHDSKLNRVTNAEGPTEGHTWKELRALDVIHEATGVKDKILSFEDFLRLFGWREITFAIEIKEIGIEKEVIDLLNRYNMKSKTTITSFQFEAIRNAKEYDPEYPVGYLVKQVTDEVMDQLREIGAEQICPQAKNLTSQMCLLLKDMGYQVRAWGCSTEELMIHAAECGVDGMTVNFPDRLKAYMERNVE